MELHFFKLLRLIKLNRLYFLYALLFGCTTLIIPFGVQYIVNNLALAGIWSNTIIFLVILSIGLLFSLFLNYGQFIVREYLQRHVFAMEIKEWNLGSFPMKSHYYFEVMSLMKTYASAFSTFVELGLVVIVGVFAVILMHPYFIIFPLIIGAGFYLFSRSVKYGVQTCIVESNAKYAIYNNIKETQILEPSIEQFMQARSKHYKVLKFNNTVALFLVLIVQILILGLGVFLVEIQQMSIGQFVSAEIIISGILGSILKLPKALEEMFDFETSKYKLDYAKKLK
jgi:hypothetical protein